MPLFEIVRKSYSSTLLMLRLTVAVLKINGEHLKAAVLGSGGNSGPASTTWLIDFEREMSRGRGLIVLKIMGQRV